MPARQSRGFVQFVPIRLGVVQSSLSVQFPHWTVPQGPVHPTGPLLCATTRTPAPAGQEMGSLATNRGGGR